MTGQPPSGDPARSGPLRVLVVMPLGTALGGGEEMLRQLLREGRGRGIEWIVAFLRNGPMVGEVRALGVECHVVEAGRFRQVWRRIAAVRTLSRIARARHVHCCFGWMVAGQAMAGPVALLAGVPCAWYQVGTPRPDWLDRFATLWPAVGVLALSREGVTAQERLWPRRPVTLVHPGVALDRAAAARATPPAAMRTRLGLPGKGPIVGTVSRLQRWKGVHVFLDAIALLQRTHPGLHAVVVGGAHETEPEYERELHAQALRLGIGDAVTFAGFQANAMEWMQAMDVVVHAAEREPFGIVVVEAMALGKPVVVGAAGGPAEIVRDGMDGLLAPCGDAEGIARAVGRYLSAPEFAAAAGAAATARAADFSAAAYAANVCQAVRRMAIAVPSRA